MKAMTAQIPDYVKVDRRRYAIAGVAGGPLWDPKQAGVIPAPMHTACWRGNICTYAVRDRALVLAELELAVGSTQNGRELTADIPILGARPSSTEHNLIFRFKKHAVEVPFSGGLLLGHGFVQRHYRHMGFNPAWRYETVIELVLTEGRVDEVRDRSAEVAALRERIEAGVLPDPDSGQVGPAWIDRTFTLGYERTFGID